MFPPLSFILKILKHRHHTEAVISLMSTQIRKYANRWCEGFFCSRLFFCVSVLSDFGFVEQ